MRHGLVVLVALLAACPGGPEGPGPEPDLSGPAPDLTPPPGPYEACVAHQQALYGRLEACGAAPYNTYLEGFIRYRCTRVQQRVVGGTVRYQPEKLAGCLDTLGKTPCTTGALLQAFSAAGCGIFVGTRPDGAGCLDGDECLDGTCSTSTACPGTCRAYRDVGQSCATHPCRLGLLCNNAVMPPTCVALPEAGQPCDQGRCQPGLYCDGGTCREPKASGPCQQSSQCALGTRCVGSPGECRPYKKLQEACSDDNECLPGLICTDGICYTYPRAGGACGRVPGHSRLVACIESYCDAAAGMEGRCVAHIPEGRSCDQTRSDQCVADTNCTGGRCTRTACSAYR